MAQTRIIDYQQHRIVCAGIDAVEAVYNHLHIVDYAEAEVFDFFGVFVGDVHLIVGGNTDVCTAYASRCCYLSRHSSQLDEAVRVAVISFCCHCLVGLVGGGGLSPRAVLRIGGVWEG